MDPAFLFAPKLPPPRRGFFIGAGTRDHSPGMLAVAVAFC
jgi:hypothetical protein